MAEHEGWSYLDSVNMKEFSERTNEEGWASQNSDGSGSFYGEGDDWGHWDSDNGKTYCGDSDDDSDSSSNPEDFGIGDAVAAAIGAGLFAAAVNRSKRKEEEEELTRTREEEEVKTPREGCKTRRMAEESCRAKSTQGKAHRDYHPNNRSCYCAACELA